MTRQTNLRLRVWAATIRDQGGPRAAEASTLCALLDMLPRIVASNLRATTLANISLLVGRLVVGGESGPCCEAAA